MNTDAKESDPAPLRKYALGILAGLAVVSGIAANLYVNGREFPANYKLTRYSGGRTEVFRSRILSLSNADGVRYSSSLGETYVDTNADGKVDEIYVATPIRISRTNLFNMFPHLTFRKSGSGMTVTLAFPFSGVQYRNFYRSAGTHSKRFKEADRILSWLNKEASRIKPSLSYPHQLIWGDYVD